VQLLLAVVALVGNVKLGVGQHQGRRALLVPHELGTWQEGDRGRVCEGGGCGEREILPAHMQVQDQAAFIPAPPPQNSCSCPAELPQPLAEPEVTGAHAGPPRFSPDVLKKLFLTLPTPPQDPPQTLKPLSPDVLKKLFLTSGCASPEPDPAADQSYTPALAGPPLLSGIKAARRVVLGPEDAGLRARPVTPLMVIFL
jgi:hypothetical protein